MGHKGYSDEEANQLVSRFNDSKSDRTHSMKEISQASEKILEITKDP